MKTEGGLRLHSQVFHKHEAVKVEKEKPVKAAPKTTKTKKATSKAKEVTADHAELAEKKIALYKAIKKKWPSKATSFKEGDKVKKSELTKIFPAETTVPVMMTIGHQPLSKCLEATYVVTKIIIHKSGWKTVRLRGKRTLVSWREGDMGKKYKVSFPIVCPV
jgi:hypothetical protein